MTTAILVNLLALWALATGVLEVFAAARLRGEGALSLGGAGVTSLACGSFLALGPRASGPAVVMTLGSYAVVFGLFMALLTVRLRAGARGLSEAARG